MMKIDRLNIFSCLIMIGLMGCLSRSSYASYEFLNSFSMVSPKAEVVELRHKKSGAKIVLVKNKDQARTFMATFKTPPYDNTGLFHIFEHAVLAGSRLYPSKSNFFRVSRSSVASFINAMTGSVYTKYPFVTRDPKDFENLLSVYMDTVFFPKAVHDPRIIKREGWRYEVDPETKTMSVNGVVVNEMKGAYTDPYRNLHLHLNRTFLPQTPYAYSSGGFPGEIAGLHFDQIVEAHKKYYHPQNSIIYLYGDIDYGAVLATMDEKFLRHFEKTADFVSPEIALQKDFRYPTPVVEASYQGPKAPNKDFVVKGYVLGRLSSLERDIAYILITAFFSETASPLRLRLLKEGLVQSTQLVPLEGKDSVFGFVFEGTDASKRKDIEKILEEEIDKVIRGGLDQELIISILNKYEFSFKEKLSNGSHRGLDLGHMVSQNWLYPELSLQEDLDVMGRFKELREILSSNNVVKKFFKNHLKENSRTRFLVMRPDPLFLEKINARIEKRVQEALKEKSLVEYQKEDEAYRQWTRAEESAEVIGKTPLLQISDIRVDEKPIDFNRFQIESTEVIEYPQNTSGISYVKFFFDLKGVKKEHLKNLEFFTDFLRKMDTTNYSFQDLSKQIAVYTGGINFGVSSYQSLKNPQTFKPMLVVSLRFLNENLEKSFALLQELLMKTKFTPLERLGNLLNETKTVMANTVSQRAMGLAIKAAGKNFFPAMGAFRDEIDGGAFEEYILNSMFDPKTLSSQLREIRKSVFNKNRLSLVTITTTGKDLKKIGSAVGKLRRVLPSGVAKDRVWSFTDQKHYDSFAIPGEVQYVVQATSSSDHLRYHGSMKVYANYLDANFMHPRLREQGGAYGAQSFFDGYGSFFMITYRDPHLEKSFETFSQVIDFMKNKKLDDGEKLRRAVLGSLKSYYEDKSILEKTDYMTMLYLIDMSWDDAIQRRREVLSTTPEDFQRISKMLEKALKEKSQKAVSGESDKLKREAPHLKRTLRF